MAEPGRWAQLTYASFDPGDGAGGWQVKETRGEFSPAELREISAHLVTSFDSHVPLPEYPTPADVAAQPRRCVHLLAHGGAIGAGSGAPADVSAGCTVHAVQAGNDSTGRPGNVFSQAVLDRRPTEPEPRLRPIELWRSFDLLTPYGAQEVLDARLRDGQYPAPSGLMGRDLVLDFIFDASTWRMGVLSVLLDAVAEALHGGRRVVLVTAGPDQTALWIAAVSWCMAPTTARAFSWSVYERAARLGAAVERGVHLIGVPREDAGRIDRDAGAFIVIDEDELPSLGQLGAAAHHTAAGDDVQATAWSQLAQESLVDAPTAAGVLGMLDDVADRAGPRVLTPPWPLAVAHLATAPDGSDTSVAAEVVAAEAPSGDLDPGLAQQIRDAVRLGLDAGTEAAWEALEATAPDAPRAAVIADEYLSRALGDVSWMARDGGVPVPAPAAMPSGPSDAVRAAYAAALESWSGEADGADARGEDAQGTDARGTAAGAAEPGSAVSDGGTDGADTTLGTPADAPAGADPAVMLRLADVGLRAGLLDDPALRERTLDALQRHVAPRLLRDGAGDGAAGQAQRQGKDETEAFLVRAGLLDPRLHLELVPEALRAIAAARTPGAADRATAAGAPAGLLHPMTVAWIGERGLPAAHTPAGTDDDPVGDEVAAWVVRHRPSEPGAGKALAGRLLGRYGSWYGIPSGLRVLEPRHLWHLDELFEVERDHPSGLPGEFFESHFACSPHSPDLTRLAERIAMRGSTHEAYVARTRLDAEAAGSRLPSVSPDDTLTLAEQLWTAFGQHFALEVFAPLDLEAALVSAASRLDVRDWSDQRVELLRAAAVASDATERATAMLESHLAWTPEPAGREILAGLLALDVATDPANADRLDESTVARVKRAGELADGMGHRVVTRAVDALVAGLDDEFRRALITDAVARLVTVGEVPERRRSELERLVAQRLRGDDRAGGDGWFRPFRNRQLKEH